MTIHFDTNGVMMQYAAGQFINLHIHINGAEYVRSYSLSSWYHVHRCPTITVKKVKGGLVSSYLVDELKEGTLILVEGPIGSFTPSSFAQMTQNVVLIAGGSGISPLWSIAHFFLYQTGANVTLLYGNRKADEIIFLDQIGQLQKLFSERFAVFHALSQEPKLPLKIKEGVAARLSPLILRKALKKLLPDSFLTSAFFICGPEGLMADAHECLLGLGIESGQLQQESFAGADVNKATPEPDLSDEREVLMLFEEQVNLLDVMPKEAILDAALRERINVSYSCRTGTCGTCWAKKTSGEVWMRANYALQPAQVEEGYVLLCQTYPLTDDVTVEINPFI
ncbi:MAG TPA: 2Fe-2S iron-sulfur cluster-binding protein [Flavisolibacter sp.]|nr:2Fe-2S iron-sulfur cluster-binding protein [Flavisolibacter sp.]